MVVFSTKMEIYSLIGYFFSIFNLFSIFAAPKPIFILVSGTDGTLAQSVEQQTENLCVPGSIPGGTTKPTQTSGFFVFYKVVVA